MSSNAEKKTERLKYIESKVRSTIASRRAQEEVWQRCVAQYLGKTGDTMEYSGSFFSAQMNLTAQAVNTKAAYLNANPVRPLVVPRDNNEPITYFLKTSSQQKMSQILTMAQNAEVEAPLQEMQGVGPFDQNTYDQMLMLGMSDEDFVKLDDDLVSDVLSQELEIEWSMDHCDQWLAASNEDKLVIGQSDALPQWDAQQNRFHAETLYAYDVFVDPRADSFSRADWVAVREVLSRGEAKARWPMLAEEIRTMESNDPIIPVQGSRYRNMSDSDDFVIHWTYWEKNADYDMSEEEANAEGHVFPHGDDGAAHVNGDEGPEALAEDGSNWPKSAGMLQLELIGDYVLFDGQSPFGEDIPVSRNYNVRQVVSTNGLGDPYILSDMQEMINRTLSQFAENLAQYRGSAWAMPETVYQGLEEQLKDVFRSANMKLSIPDNIFEAMNGQVLQELKPAQIPQSMIQLFELLVNQFFRLAGVPAALRGDTQSGTSGRAMEISTSNASEPIAQVSRNTEMFLRKFLRTAVYLIVEYLPTDVFVSRNKGVEPHVWDAIRERIRRTGYDVDVQVSGSNRQDAEAARLTQLAQAMPQLWQCPTFAQVVFKKMNVPDGAQIVRELKMIMQPQPAQIGMPQARPAEVANMSSTVPPSQPPGPRPGANEAR